ncbi:MAG: SIS domain-containing protein [Armatimonadetes bacterium]|nr:SIS domain-containing protein [Armatimonadota bacterium]
MQLGEWMEREMREQPELLAANASPYFENLKAYCADLKPEMILLAARGSSDHAALYARYLIEIHLGIPVCLAAPSVITKYGTKVKYPHCLAVGISQSGAAPDVSEVIAYMRSQGHPTLAITNTPGSRLSQEADHTLLLNAGEEKSIAATKTYTASLLAMYQLVRALGAELPDPVGGLPTEKFFESSRKAAAECSGLIVRCNPIFTLARGYSFCNAFETTLKLMECALIPAKAYSTADFEHGPKALARPNTACVIFGPTPDGLVETGAEVISAPGANSGPLDPISDILFGQWLALYSARARGLNPDQAHNLSKVTRTL